MKKWLLIVLYYAAYVGIFTGIVLLVQPISFWTSALLGVLLGVFSILEEAKTERKIGKQLKRIGLDINLLDQYSAIITTNTGEVKHIYQHTK